ncbi:MAG: hypothetical protein A3G59_00715 [Candidatus Taylorbacteria bacterium RIFCSPLOWO2_12_FULL_47_20]|uniref:Uncharacterized protein n=2 Tax=Candidatus Tayloriibacteriota TaxID=1817919 RepID=A0A1G2P964_9BACT|nr:MAG: hypothetical protein A3H68_01525 [Candidatus Taylorbacteria bacterium RIFCSPLOWO2_02_FULL_46_40]OHA44162.1 MAG: hypothetical protein A3G59_00715 [Candidatus Taylorbacteria bacterium RIFCSPLOWO2_12_FULL_47_20]
MNLISIYLEKFRSAHAQSQQFKRLILEMIRGRSGVIVGEEGIKIFENVLTIICPSSVQMNEIYLHKASILLDLGLNLSTNHIKEIRLCFR